MTDMLFRHLIGNCAEETRRKQRFMDTHGKAILRSGVEQWERVQRLNWRARGGRTAQEQAADAAAMKRRLRGG